MSVHTSRHLCIRMPIPTPVPRPRLTDKWRQLCVHVLEHACGHARRDVNPHVCWPSLQHGNYSLRQALMRNVPLYGDGGADGSLPRAVHTRRAVASAETVAAIQTSRASLVSRASHVSHVSGASGASPVCVHRASMCAPERAATITTSSHETPLVAASGFTGAGTFRWGGIAPNLQLAVFFSPGGERDSNQEWSCRSFSRSL